MTRNDSLKLSVLADERSTGRFDDAMDALQDATAAAFKAGVMMERCVVAQFLYDWLDEHPDNQGEHAVAWILDKIEKGLPR